MTFVGMSAVEVVRVVEWLGSRSAVYQVNGGWAVDALYGSQTRSHADLDIFVDATVVDDLIAWLKSAGYEVVEAVDGMDGLDKAKARTVNLVLTDQNMPRMDGLTLIKNLRGLPAYKTVPILMLTTESSDAMKTAGKAAGATGWLVKPFDPQKLLEVVKKVIG